jgi:hypothetical protein
LFAAGFGAQARDDGLELSAELLDGDDLAFCDGGNAVAQTDECGVLLGVRVVSEAEESEGSEEK